LGCLNMANSTHDPRLSTLRQVAQALEIPLDELLASLRVKLESKG
jgi:transcriptional regulator with XRE-family HTH domain